MILLTSNYFVMKYIFFLFAVLATVSMQKTFAQDSTTTQSSILLHSYFDIKNALIAGNAGDASVKALEFVKALSNNDSKIGTASVREALLKDANQISTGKDIKQQRENFASLSINMYVLAKTSKLTTQPVYYAFCPMKKSYWLSSDPAIKNPYFGSSMLTCGKVVETINQ
jgi:hypothetical protein